MKDSLSIQAIKGNAMAASAAPGAGSDVPDADSDWEREEGEAPLPTPPGTSAPPSVHYGTSPADASTIRAAFQAAHGVPVPPAIEEVQSSLSVTGGHSQGDGHQPGHLWPSQISPNGSPSISRASTPAPPAVGTEGAKGSPLPSFPGRSNPRNGSPVYLSPGDYAATFEVHRLIGEVDGGGSQGLAESGKQQQQQRPTLLANQKIDELHVAGHGSVDVVETTPTITLRYSSNVPASVRKQTDALKNELVGIETEDSASDDSGSERSRSASASAAACPSGCDIPQP
ncbi:hypothetical protein H4R19_003491 [Coemansia spiralis]|nr:hypothetical protein H4R19_003491 [Coemansia spiralis]